MKPVSQHRLVTTNPNPNMPNVILSENVSRIYGVALIFELKCSLIGFF